MNSFDPVTISLNNYHQEQETLESYNSLMLPERRGAIIDYSKKILRGDVDKKEYDWVFYEYIDPYLDDETYTKEFNEAIDNWNIGFKPSDELEAELLWSICHTALSSASNILYDEEFENMFDNLGKTIKEVMNNVN